MELNKNMFREYDIRGVYKIDIDKDIAYKIGRAFGTKCRELNIPKTVVAHDNRLSSPELSEGLIQGIIDTGTNVIDIGLATTPMCYFAANYLNTNCSMMITASHNPKEYNGFKFSYNGVHNAYGKDVMEIYNIIENNKFEEGRGIVEEKDIRDAYIDLVVNKLEFGKNKIKVIYDCGNGTTSIIADDIFNKLPKDKIEFIPLFNVSDGNFPNHHPDPCVYENLYKLRDKVLEEKADIGIGYDGDGDRVGFIDEKGNMIETDKFMIIMWRNLVNKVAKKEGLFDVKCTKALEDEMIKLGVNPVEYRTGNSYTRAASANGDYPLSGELSGHVYFRDKWPGYDDGIYVGMRLLEVLTNTNKKASELLEGINKYYSTEEGKIKVDDSIKFNIISRVEEYCKEKGYKYITLDGVKVKYDDGFALVRASNTGPNITTRFEATTKERLNELEKEFTDLVKSLI